MKYIVILFLVITTTMSAQEKSRKYILYNVNSDHIEIICDDGKYNIKYLDTNIVETTFYPNGEINNTKSHIVELPSIGKPKIYETEEQIELLGSPRVVISKSPFKIEYFRNKELLITETLGYYKKEHKPLMSVADNIQQDSIEVIQFAIDKHEILYGGGSRAMDLNRRGKLLPLYNKAHYGYEQYAELLNFCVPLVISSKIYAIHFDNSTIGYLDFDSQSKNILEYQSLNGRKTYQVIVAKSWPKLMAKYGMLTGTQPLPPIWSLGNFSSRFGYRNQEEVVNTIKKFKENEIPVDALILDLFWFGKNIQGTMGNLEWDKDNFPEPKSMIKNLKDQGVKTVAITEPFILKSSSNWNNAIKAQILATKISEPTVAAEWEFYFGNTGLIDIFKHEGNKWLWGKYKELYDDGVKGIWGDLGEPEALPKDVNTTAGSSDKIHNIYGHNWAKLIHDNYKSEFPKERPFILMRAGYSGSQKFGIIPWSGDVSRSWGGLQSQPAISLSMGMQGIGYMHSDLGGFAGDYFDNELYLRWLQYGVFQPVFRPHAHETVASEVARKDVVTMAKAKKLVELRYKMLPYNYSLAYENSKNCMPLMRPIFFEEPNNFQLSNKSDIYLWGPDFLVKPIMESKIKNTKMYFPATSNWYDFYTGKKYYSGTNKIIKVYTNYIPTFVRGSIFFPMTKLVQSTDFYDNKFLDLHLYFEGKSVKLRKFYFDDGLTANANNDTSQHDLLSCYAKYKNNLLSIYLESQNVLELTRRWDKTGEIKIYRIDKKPKSVIISESKSNFDYNKKTKTLTIPYQHHKFTKIDIQM